MGSSKGKGEDKRVIIKREGKYYRVPVEALYKDVDEEELSYRTRIPIKRIKQGRNGDYLVSLRLQRVIYRMSTDFTTYRREMMRDLDIDRQERDIIERAIQYLGGLRFKTKTGVGIEFKMVRKGEQRLVRTDTITIVSAIEGDRIGRKVMDLPNLYGTGGICWGNVEIPKEVKMEQVEVLFSRFLTSRFNADIVRHRRSNRINQIIHMLKQRELELREEDVPGDLKKARELYIRAIEDGGLIGTFINLEIATLFDLDNIEIDKMV